MKKKRIIIAFAALILVISLLGCEPENNSEPSLTPVISDTPTPSPTPDADTTCNGCNDDFGNFLTPAPEKPVIYLYPEVPTEVTVRLDFNGRLTFTYPEYKEAWRVMAYPDGRLECSETNREYAYLFWEGISNVPYDMSRGFVVKGCDTVEFLENILLKMGLNSKECNDFIVYWAPRMINNPYNLINFQTNVYTDNAKLEIDPEPDSMLRVFMTFKALDKPIEIGEPEIETIFERNGFCVVEWGGAEIK